ncbi:MAG TPA: hypothetical protein V6D29_24045 [Leptolyngbyaceae cyanobacterium]
MRPTILLIEPDDTVRPILVDNLKRWGYHLIVALDEADAFERAESHGYSFDLLLINQFKGSIEHFIAIGRGTRQQAGLDSSIPLVIMADQFEPKLEGQNLQVGEGEYVTYLEDGQQLKRLLFQLCPI